MSENVKSVVVVEPDIDPALHQNLSSIPSRKRAERIRRLASIGLLLERGAETGNLAIESKPVVSEQQAPERKKIVSPNDEAADAKQDSPALANQAFASAFGQMGTGIVN